MRTGRTRELHRVANHLFRDWNLADQLVETLHIVAGEQRLNRNGATRRNPYNPQVNKLGGSDFLDKGQTRPQRFKILAATGGISCDWHTRPYMKASVTHRVAEG